MGVLSTLGTPSGPIPMENRQRAARHGVCDGTPVGEVIPPALVCCLRDLRQVGGGSGYQACVGGGGGHPCPPRVARKCREFSVLDGGRDGGWRGALRGEGIKASVGNCPQHQNHYHQPQHTSIIMDSTTNGTTEKRNQQRHQRHRLMVTLRPSPVTVLSRGTEALRCQRDQKESWEKGPKRAATKTDPNPNPNPNHPIARLPLKNKPKHGPDRRSRPNPQALP